jgi:hypothetical protein
MMCSMSDRTPGYIIPLLFEEDGLEIVFLMLRSALHVSLLNAIQFNSVSEDSAIQ